MTKLSDAQTAILAASAASEDATTSAPANAESFVAGLINRGLIIAIPQSEGPSRLMITEAGRAAIAPRRRNQRTLARRQRRWTTATAEPGDPPLDAKPPVTDPASPKGKVGVLLGLLRQEGGTTVEAMMAATGWQAHSVRGACPGRSRRSLGLEVASEKTDGGADLPHRRARRHDRRRLSPKRSGRWRRLDLEGLRAEWRRRFGPPPKLRSPELLRLALAWRIQAEALGGLDAPTRRRLRDAGRRRSPATTLGGGTRITREWQGETPRGGAWRRLV